MLTGTGAFSFSWSLPCCSPLVATAALASAGFFLLRKNAAPPRTTTSARMVMRMLRFFRLRGWAGASSISVSPTIADIDVSSESASKLRCRKHFVSGSKWLEGIYFCWTVLKVFVVYLTHYTFLLRSTITLDISHDNLI